MSVHFRQWMVVGLLFFVVILGTAGRVFGQYQALTQGMATSDDPRRVPVPPHDSSKDSVLVLKGGRLFDGTGADPVPDAVIVIVGNRIVDVGAVGRVKIPAKVDRTIDLKGLFVVPGLIDAHTHATGQFGEDFGRYRESEAAIAIRAVRRLGLFLDGGITSVRDMGGPGDVAQKIKEAVQRRIFPGPRTFWAGHMIVTRGGHADEVTETASGAPRGLDTAPRLRVATGPNDWRLAVREEIRRGVDFIKMTAPYTKEEISAGVDEAHMLGFRVAVDAFGDYVKWGAEAGVDTNEHPLNISDETLKVMADRKTAMVPTEVAFYNPLTQGYPSAHIPPGGFYFTMSRRFPLTHEGNLATIRKARVAGVKIGVGTDVPFENEKRYPADYFVELGFLKEAGLTNKDVLMAATRVNSELLGIPDKLGTIEKGKLADLLVVAADPLQDIQNLRQMKLVVADGRVVRDRVENGPVPPEPTRLK